MDDLDAILDRWSQPFREQNIRENLKLENPGALHERSPVIASSNCEREGDEGKGKCYYDRYLTGWFREKAIRIPQVDFVKFTRLIRT